MPFEYSKVSSERKVFLKEQCEIIELVNTDGSQDPTGNGFHTKWTLLTIGDGQTESTIKAQALSAGWEFAPSFIAKMRIELGQLPSITDRYILKDGTGSLYELSNIWDNSLLQTLAFTARPCERMESTMLYKHQDLIELVNTNGSQDPLNGGAVTGWIMVKNAVGSSIATVKDQNLPKGFKFTTYDKAGQNIEFSKLNGLSSHYTITDFEGNIYQLVARKL